jgi:hypothetical protein
VVHQCDILTRGKYYYFKENNENHIFSSFITKNETSMRLKAENHYVLILSIITKWNH